MRESSYALPKRGRIAIELLFFVAELLIEIVGQVLFEVLASAGWRTLSDGVRPERESHPVLAVMGQFVLGLLGGGLSLLILSRRVWGTSPLPGASLILSPLGTGLAMHMFGKVWPAHYGDKPGLLSFGGGAPFAFGMALVRFIYFEDPWQWWPR